MGRYDAADVPEGAPLHEIRMVGVPVEIFLAARQQHDELMREFAVLALAHQDQSSAAPAELRRLVHELGANSAAARRDRVRRSTPLLKRVSRRSTSSSTCR